MRLRRQLSRVFGRAVVRAVAGIALGVIAPLAGAGYFQWDMVELPADSGAACGDGSPYRFFVNRTPTSHSTVIVFEGGGACWDQDACLGIGPLSAANPNGIPPDYMHKLTDMAAFGLVTPFSSRNDPFQAVQTQGWNIVYMPYCTGDVHSGNKVAVYSDTNPSNPRVEYHRGAVNAQAAANWLRTNMGRPRDLLLTGFSAGGVGSTVSYVTVRDTLQPTGKSSLLADSGPLMPAPRSGSPQQYPSLPLHNKIRSAWGLDDPDGLVTRLSGLPGFDVNDLGSTSGALAQRYPDDRFGYLVFQADSDFSAFSYTDFWPDVGNAPDPQAYNRALFSKWEPDINRWRSTLEQHDNIGYFVPFFRNFNLSHCLTIVDFSGTGVQQDNIADISPFVDAVLDRGTMMREYETDHVSDFHQTLSPAIILFKILSALFGIG